MLHFYFLCFESKGNHNEHESDQQNWPSITYFHLGIGLSCDRTNDTSFGTKLKFKIMKYILRYIKSD